MMRGDKYPCSTVAEMCAIPDEALPRMLAELPSIIETLREMRAAIPELAVQTRAKAPWPFNHFPLKGYIAALKSGLGKTLIWVDDDKGLATFSAKWREGDDPFFSRTEPASGTEARQGGDGEAGSVHDGPAREAGDAQ